MSAANKSDLRPEIAHVLFMDIVGYSKLSINEQTDFVGKLNEIVRQTSEFCVAEAAGKLVRLPAGDGMALVFFNSPEAPVRCAVEISRALKNEPTIALRMGINSGPVNEVLDVNERSNVAGAGIDNARRVMECGDAGHILLSKRAADDLMPYKQWRAHLQELGEAAIKHGKRISIFNFYTGEVGNPHIPAKLKERSAPQVTSRTFILTAVAIALVVLVAIGAFFIRQRSTTSTSTTVAGKSIAVLPFENLSKDEENAFFAGGVQDEILSNLSKIADLKVISRTSVMKYKSGPERNLRDIAKFLGVAHVVEGSVQRAGNRVRVSAQLVDARSDNHLWAEHYDRDLADVFAIQSEIARAIAEQLQAKLSPREKDVLRTKPTQDTEAYDFYIRAKEMMRGTPPQSIGFVEIYGKAIGLLEKAVARDSNFALAYCLLAEANLSLYWEIERVPGSRERGEIAVEAARRLAPQAGETYLAEALFFYWGNRDYERALHSLQEAARLLPNNVDVLRYSAWIERRLGRWEECIRHQEKAAELDPRNWLPRDDLLSSYQLLHDYAAAVRVAARAISDFPDKADHFRAKKAEMESYAGDLKAARTTLSSLPSQDHFAWQLFYVALLERNYDEVLRLLSVWNQRHEPDEPDFPRSFVEGWAARGAGQPDRARSAFLATEATLLSALGRSQGTTGSHFSARDSSCGARSKGRGIAGSASCSGTAAHLARRRRWHPDG